MKRIQKDKLFNKFREIWVKHGLNIVADQLDSHKIKFCWGLKGYDYLPKSQQTNVIIGERGYFDRYNYFTINLIETFLKKKFIVNSYDKTNWNKLNIKLLQPKEHGECVLFCTQKPNNSVLSEMKQYLVWVNDVVLELLKCNKKVIFREHPLDRKRVIIKNLKKSIINNDNFSISKDSLENDFKKSYVTISYNSSSLIDSLIHGVPIIAYSELSVVYEFSNTMDDLKNDTLSFPNINDLEDKFCLLANNQFPNKEKLTDKYILNLKSQFV